MKRAVAIILLFFACSFSSKAQLTDQEIHALKRGRVKPHTNYIYALPFSTNSKFLLIQAYNSKMSHSNELSLDFKMKPGSKVCAAREGVVIATKEDSDRGGLKSEYMSDGNHIIIRHADGSTAMYWHLRKDGVLVNAGDMVQKGQHIGYSGNTGYSAFPHLHFQVQDAGGRKSAVHCPIQWPNSLCANAKECASDCGRRLNRSCQTSGKGCVSPCSSAQADTLSPSI